MIMKELITQCWSLKIAKKKKMRKNHFWSSNLISTFLKISRNRQCRFCLQKPRYSQFPQFSRGKNLQYTTVQLKDTRCLQLTNLHVSFIFLQNKKYITTLKLTSTHFGNSYESNQNWWHDNYVDETMQFIKLKRTFMSRKYCTQVINGNQSGNVSVAAYSVSALCLKRHHRSPMGFYTAF